MTPRKPEKHTQQPVDSLQKLAATHPRILVLGVGSLGCYLVAKAQLAGLPAQVEFALLHQKQALLLGKPSVHTFLLQGAEADLCSQLSSDDYDRLQTLLLDMDLVILCSALGGHSGEILVELASLMQFQQSVLAFVVTPFHFEGGARQQRALATLQQLENHCSSVLELPNDVLRKAVGGKTALHIALDASNVFLHQLLSQLLNILAEPSLINLDVSDFKHVLKHPGRMVVGWLAMDFARPLGPQLEQLLQQPLLAQFPLQTARAGMVHLEVSADFEMGAFYDLHAALQQRLPQNGLLLSGLRIHPQQAQPRITLCLTGVNKETADPG